MEAYAIVVRIEEMDAESRFLALLGMTGMVAGRAGSKSKAAGRSARSTRAHSAPTHSTPAHFTLARPRSRWLRQEIRKVGLFLPFINTTRGCRSKSCGGMAGAVPAMGAATPVGVT